MPRKKAATGSGSILSYFGREPPPAPAPDRPRTPDRASTVSALSPLNGLTPTSPRSFAIPRDDVAAGSPSASNVEGSPRSSPPARPEPREPLSRDAEIAASDDDESDDFEPLEALLAPRAGPSTPSAKRLSTNHVSTPDRRPGSLFSSPLTIQPRVVRHFAMDDLLKDAKRDLSTEETFKRLQARQEDARAREKPRVGADSLRDTLMATVGDEEDHRLDKVVRAVERTERTAARRGWFFFRSDAGASEPNRFPFPARAARDVYLKKKSVSGPQDLDLRLLGLSLKLKKMALPDELFLWMLDEVCLEESDTRRDEMCRIMRLHISSTISNQITASYLEGLFMRLGATADIRSFLGNTSSEPLETVGAPEEGLYRRDWRNLCSVLETLLVPSRELGPKSMLYCVQAAMAMAVDPELFHDPEVLLLCRKLLLSVASAFSVSEWDSAVSLHPPFALLPSRPSNAFQKCEYIATFVYNAFPYPPMRLRSLTHLPTSTKAAHELRRRMAAVFFFEDLSLSTQPADSLKLHDITAHLRSPAFKVRQDTDYAALRALVLLLDMAVDTGSRPEGDDALRAAFDREVDDLAAALRQLARSINDTQMKSILPMEAKMVMDLVGERIAHTVRSRPKPKISIYDLPRGSAVDPHLPQQQNLMKKFLQSRQGGGSGGKASV